MAKSLTPAQRDREIILILSEPCEGLGVHLFPEIPPPHVTCGDDGDRIEIHDPMKKTVPWQTVFDVLERRGLTLRSFSCKHTYEGKASWRWAERDQVVGAVLRRDDVVDLRNPISDLSHIISHRPPVGVLPDEIPVRVSRRPRGLIAEAGCEHLFARPFLDLLRERGAQCDIQEVILRGKPLEDWSRVFPKHREAFLWPQCLRDPGFDEEYAFIVNLGMYLAAGPPRGWSLCMDTAVHGFPGRDEFHLIDLPTARAFLERFPRHANSHMAPIFKLDGPIGRHFQAVRARALPLLVKPSGPRMTRSRRAMLAKQTPEFVPKSNETLCTLSGPKFRFGLVESSPGSGGRTLTERRFDCLLFKSGRLPEGALEAPLASWLLARLTAEAGGVFDQPSDRIADGGGLVHNFIVEDAVRGPIAGFQLIANTVGIWMSINADAAIEPQAVVEDFLGLLVSAPENLAKCRVRVRDPEMRHMPEEYEPAPDGRRQIVFGWDGSRFLGADNVWDVGATHRERPEKYIDHLMESCSE